DARAIGDVSVVQREWAAKNPRATFRTPIIVEDVLNSRMIAYPFWKWCAVQAAVLMRNNHREIAIFAWYVGSVPNKPGTGNMTANYIDRGAWLSERNHPGNQACSSPEQIGRSGQCDQRQVVADPTGAGRPLRHRRDDIFGASAGRPARRSDLTVVGADKLGLLNDVGL